MRKGQLMAKEQPSQFSTRKQEFSSTRRIVEEATTNRKVLSDRLAKFSTDLQETERDIADAERKVQAAINGYARGTTSESTLNGLLADSGHFEEKKATLVKIIDVVTGDIKTAQADEAEKLVFLRQLEQQVYSEIVNLELARFGKQLQRAVYAYSRTGSVGFSQPTPREFFSNIMPLRLASLGFHFDPETLVPAGAEVEAEYLKS